MSLNLEQYAGTREFPVVDGGDYEVVITAAPATTKDKTKDFLNFGFMIRDDVDQKFQNSFIFDKAWRDKDNPDWFDLRKLGSLLKTQKGLDGYKDTFDDVEEFIQFINNRTCIITVEKKFDDYSGKEVNEVKYLSYKPSKCGDYVKPVKEATTVAKNVEHLNIPESDLPF